MRKLHLEFRYNNSTDDSKIQTLSYFFSAIFKEAHTTSTSIITIYNG